MLVYRIRWYCTVLDKKKAAFSGLLFCEGGADGAHLRLFYVRTSYVFLNLFNPTYQSVKFNIARFCPTLYLFCPIIFAPKLHPNKYGNHHST